MRCAGAPRPSLIHYRRLAKRRLLRSVCQSTRIWIKLHQSAPRLPVAVRRIERKHAIFPVGCLEWGARGFRPPRCRAGLQSKFCMGGEREDSHAHDSGRGRVANGREPLRRRALCAARGESGGSERRPGADDSAVSVIMPVPMRVPSEANPSGQIRVGRWEHAPVLFFMSLRQSTE